MNPLLKCHLACGSTEASQTGTDSTHTCNAAKLKGADLRKQLSSCCLFCIQKSFLLILESHQEILPYFTVTCSSKCSQIDRPSVQNQRRSSSDSSQSYYILETELETYSTIQGSLYAWKQPREAEMMPLILQKKEKHEKK